MYIESNRLKKMYTFFTYLWNKIIISYLFYDKNFFDFNEIVLLNVFATADRK